MFEVGKKYISENSIKNTICSMNDITNLMNHYDTLKCLCHKHNKYESYAVSEFDDVYGWEIIPDNYVSNILSSQLAMQSTLYVKVLDDVAINVYKSDQYKLSDLIVSFAPISD